MLNYELCLEKQSVGGYSTHSSANVATRGCGTPWSHGGYNNTAHGHGRARGNGRDAPSGNQRGGFTNNFHHRGGGSSSTGMGGQQRPQCQVCLKVGHTANVCCYRFDGDYVLDNRLVVMACPSTIIDPNWYLASGVTYHITSELEKLTMHERYNDNDQIRAACLHLNHVLNVPHAHKHLVSIHRFTLDNHTFIELHPYFFLIKDQVSKKVLLRGPCRGGLYPLPGVSSPAQKLIFFAIRLSSSR
jgi:hypothetical protein